MLQVHPLALLLILCSGAIASWLFLTWRLLKQGYRFGKQCEDCGREIHVGRLPVLAHSDMGMICTRCMNDVAAPADQPDALFELTNQVLRRKCSMCPFEQRYESTLLIPNHWTTMMVSTAEDIQGPSHKDSFTILNQIEHETFNLCPMCTAKYKRDIRPVLGKVESWEAAMQELQTP